MSNTNPKKRLDPARTVVAKLGGVRATARVLQLNPSAVSRWMVGRDRKGTGGAVPLKHWQTLLNYAKQQHIKLTFNDLSNIR
jgi:hypothetical protein